MCILAEFSKSCAVDTVSETEMLQDEKFFKEMQEEVSFCFICFEFQYASDEYEGYKRSQQGSVCYFKSMGDDWYNQK